MMIVASNEGVFTNCLHEIMYITLKCTKCKDLDSYNTRFVKHMINGAVI